MDTHSFLSFLGVQTKSCSLCSEIKIKKYRQYYTLTTYQCTIVSTYCDCVCVCVCVLLFRISVDNIPTSHLFAYVITSYCSVGHIYPPDI